MAVSPDLTELLHGLSAAKVRFLIVGAHAVAFHAEPRYTKDIDLWVDCAPENVAQLWRALAAWGAPLDRVKPEDFEDPQTVFQIGIEPNRVDILMGLDAVQFARAWPRRVRAELGGVTVYFISRTDLIRTKRAANRAQDRLDLAKLTRPAAGRRRKRRS
ncbi:MAG: DUF6036 family nucleotidyltransferase [Planctomycetota bacterium]